MKTATIPSLRVEPEFRGAIEQLLEDGESLSSFVEQSLRESVERRKLNAEFLRRGLWSRDQAQRTQRYVDGDQVIGRLETMLAQAKAGGSRRA